MPGKVCRSVSEVYIGSIVMSMLITSKTMSSDVVDTYDQFEAYFSNSKSYLQYYNVIQNELTFYDSNLYQSRSQNVTKFLSVEPA